jgi:hypothetical protein
LCSLALSAKPAIAPTMPPWNDIPMNPVNCPPSPNGQKISQGLLQYTPVGS